MPPVTKAATIKIVGIAATNPMKKEPHPSAKFCQLLRKAAARRVPKESLGVMTGVYSTTSSSVMVTVE